MPLIRISLLVLIVTAPLACGGESSSEEEQLAGGSGGDAGSESSGGTPGSGGDAGTGATAGTGGSETGGDAGTGGTGASAGTGGSGIGGDAGTGGSSEHATGCVESGGTIRTALCCSGANLGDGVFPDTCMTGGCSCSPDNSVEISICDCGAEKCFYVPDGECVENLGGM